MKKVLIGISIFIVSLIILYIYFDLSTKHTSEADYKYISSLLDSELKVGMSVDDVRAFFQKQGKELVLWRGSKSNFNEDCKMVDGNKNECEEFLRSIMSLPLPGNNIFLGKGNAQIYITIDQNNKLKSIFYENYHPNLH